MAVESRGHGGRLEQQGGSTLVVFLEVVSLELLFRDQQKCGYWRGDCLLERNSLCSVQAQTQVLRKVKYISLRCSLLERWVKWACPCHKLYKQRVSPAPPAQGAGRPG